jgi:U3 small nucleolar RNA-associated protein 19
MPNSEGGAIAGQKRKRDASKSDRKQAKVKARRMSEDTDSFDPQAQILQLEAQINESRRHYNNIVALIQQAQDEGLEDEISILAAVALCRVFCRLLAAGDMVKSKGMPESEVVIVRWLKERYHDYCHMLFTQYLRSESGAKQSTGLSLIMRLIKEECRSQKDFSWKSGLPSQLVQVLLTIHDGDALREEYIEKYFTKYDDVRYYALQAIRYACPASLSKLALIFLV